MTMGPKHQGYKACLQMLAIAQQMKNKSNVGTVTGTCHNCWHNNWCDCQHNLGGPSSLIEDSPGPEIDQCNKLRTIMGHAPEVPGLEGPSLGEPNTSAHIDDSLSDSEGSSKDDNVVKISNVD